MSSTENQRGWKPSVKLRNGQTKLYELIQKEPKSVYTIQLPTGYGKSWCACIAYAVLKDRGEVDRMLIVVPTDQQRSQYVSGLIEDLRVLGISYAGIERCDNKANWVIKKSYRNESDIFVAGVQSIQADIGYYSDLMSKGRWLVVADEFHHYGSDNSWGDAIKALSYKVILGMSATPLRLDKKPTIFGSTTPDIEVSIKDAYSEGAIKRIRGCVSDYVISWSSIDEETPQNSLLSEIAKDWPANISEYEMKKGVRYYDKYISTIFLQVINTWIEYESKWPGQNQVLVFAMSCRHAEKIAGIINDIAYPGMPEPFADWIGVGDGEFDSRTPEQNDEILARFQSNKLPCLVQVNKAGEGFNNKRCSIGLFLDLVGDSPMKRQHIGRFMRVNQNAEGQDSVIFISEDSPSRQLLENFEEEFGASTNESEGNEKGGGNGGGSGEIKIPDIYIIDTQYLSDRVVYPYGSPENAIAAFLNDQSQEVQDAYKSLPEDKAKEILLGEITKWLAKTQGHPDAPLTSEQRRKQIADQVKRNTGLVVNLFLKKRFGRSIQKNVRGDVFKTINSRWAKTSGNYHSGMDEQDLKAKNEWLKELADQIQKDRIPTWLNP